MRPKSSVLAGLSLCFVAAFAAAANAAPDLVGTWQVETPVIVTGAGAHHPTNAPPPAEADKPRLRDFAGTFTVVGQEGDRFWGTLETPYYREELVGVFTGEDDRFLMVDSDGFHQGRVVAPGQIRYCYQQNTPDLRVAGCGTMTKQP
jgi:hypothetical protein